MRVSVHQPECNVWCNERGHYLLPTSTPGSPFSHQEDGDPTMGGDD